MGRYYAMDRDKRWDRVELASRGPLQRAKERLPRALQPVFRRPDDEGKADEFVVPFVVTENGAPEPPLRTAIPLYSSTSVLIGQEITHAFCDDTLTDLKERRNWIWYSVWALQTYDETHYQ